MKNQLRCHCGIDPQYPEIQVVHKQAHREFGFIKMCFTLFVLFFCMALSAQEPDPQDSVITMKMRLANKLILSNGHEQAYQLYHECANAGNGSAMNAIGIMKQRGWGTEQDETGSMDWFVQAAQAGYAKAYFNLFNIFAKALGVEQNFENAVNYLDTLHNTQHRSVALFFLGYYYYKGFGVEQNYETAVNFFLQSAEFDKPDALYFLGLCYRNGYGVAIDEEMAQYYLNRAAELGHYYAFEELEDETTEIIIEPKHISMNGENGNSEHEKLQIPKQFRQIEKQNLDKTILGEYSGTIVMYDYSGKNIVSKSNLKILFEEIINGKIFGKWIENDTLYTDFEAILTDSTLQFIDTEYKRTDRYSKNYARKWKFDNAILEKTETDSVSYLLGNIRQYDIKRKEPGKPLYISLQKNKVAPNAVILEKDFLIAYPNPFDGEINILFSIESEQNISISVYDINGNLFDQQNLGILYAGQHNYQLALSAPKGQYMLVVQLENKKFTHLIIKK
ncbi:MAG: T9SS type A sorting domain-containing protein [Marinilabiliaceae bacterium]|nr:T9SS type A sorting domain-containing protein [Marinilabiliaceae bacterium]